MKATVNGQNKLTVVQQEISKFNEAIAMKLSMILTNNTPTKVLGGLAVGALLLGATALPQGTIHAVSPAELVTLGENFYHPVSGKLNVGPAGLVTRGEEFYYPVTGELNIGPATPVNLGEEWYHPITGHPVAPTPSKGF